MGKLGLYLDMLLQILGTLEALGAERAAVRLKGDVNPDMGGNVISFDGNDIAAVPATLQAQVVGALSSDVSLTKMVLDRGQQ